MTLKLRPMRLDDAAAVARLTTQLGCPVDAKEQAARIGEVLARPEDNALLVAVDARDTPIGWAHAQRQCLMEESATAVLMGLVVNEDQRSKGIGAALTAAAEAWARARGCSSLLVRSRTSRERAHRFYEREGYERIKTSYVFGKRLV